MLCNHRHSWFYGAVAAALSTGAFGAPVAAAQSDRDIYFDVQVQGTGRATIHANVYENSAAPVGATLLGVHGFTETGATFKPLAMAIFQDPSLKRTVRRVIAIDMIAHGESSAPASLPNGLRFGDLMIEENVSVLIQSIDALRAKGLGPRVVIGHSMGGLAIQAAQEALLAGGSSLAAHGVFGAVLLAPVPPHGQPWTVGDTGDLSEFIVDDPVLGVILELPPEAALFGGGFTALDGSIVPNAPTIDEIIANDYNAIEPLTTTLQLIEQTILLPSGGPLALERPTVRRGAFALRNGTVLSVVAFSQDVLVPARDLDDLYVHLLGRDGALFRRVESPDAVHSMFISNPTGMLQAIRGVL